MDLFIGQTKIRDNDFTAFWMVANQTPQGIWGRKKHEKPFRKLTKFHLGKFLHVSSKMPKEDGDM